MEDFGGRIIKKKTTIKGLPSAHTVVREQRSWLVQGSNNM